MTCWGVGGLGTCIPFSVPSRISESPFCLSPPTPCSVSGSQTPSPWDGLPRLGLSSGCFPHKGLPSGAESFTGFPVLALPRGHRSSLLPGQLLGHGALHPLLVPLNVACTPSTLASPLTKTSPHLTNQNLSKLIFGGLTPQLRFDCQIEQVNPRSSSPLPPGASALLLRLQPTVGFPGCDAITLGSDHDHESVSNGWYPDPNRQHRKHTPARLHLASGLPHSLCASTNSPGNGKLHQTSKQLFLSQ